MSPPPLMPQISALYKTLKTPLLKKTALCYVSAGIVLYAYWKIPVTGML